MSTKKMCVLYSIYIYYLKIVSGVTAAGVTKSEN